MKFKGTISFEYEVDESFCDQGYGTHDPVEMAKIDEESIKDHGISVVDIITDGFYNISVSPME